MKNEELIINFNNFKISIMKKLILFSVFVSLCLSCFAQQELFGGRGAIQVDSPVINPNNSVTFSFLAPNAQSVRLVGDVIRGLGVEGQAVDMVKGENGVWSYTSAPMPSDFYTYSFNVDGVRSLDLNNVYVNRDVATITNMLIVGNGIGDLYSVNNVPHGTVLKTWYPSPSNVDAPMRRITVYTPPGYETSGQSYPVLYLLHGTGGDEEAWITQGRTAQVLDNLIARGLAAPMIVVMPNGNVVQEAAPGESSLGLQKPVMMLPKWMEGSFELTFPDIIKFIESSFRVKANKADRAIAGLSMGGFHSLHISRYYPNTFDYIGLFSAAIMPNESVQSPVYDNFLPTLQAQNSNGYKLYWKAMGKTDFLYQSGVDFRKQLDDIGMRYVYRESEGGHTWTNWRLYLTEFVPMLFK